ncbi:MAG: Sua5 YciO YrdC YwlC family protein [Candidatus Marinarcus sp.]|uniref:Sua5 YciO YrdC YwlC family protein n=1 Tax=Candidatus Marinarcus sp. TaxID=3100987 RepID=UPI003AFFACAB
MDASKVYLAQTDTTVGFLSKNDKKLSAIKKRVPHQKILQVVDSFKTLNTLTRVPKEFRAKVRRAKNSTFIYPNGNSYRVVSKDCAHYEFVKKMKILYSTSANETKKAFHFPFAFEHADVVVEDARGLYEAKSSHIIKLSCNRIQKLR